MCSLPWNLVLLGFCLELFKPYLNQRFHLSASLCRCCGSSAFSSACALNQSRIFTQPPAMSRNALVADEKYSNTLSNNVISFSLA
jgi:hypothetical protein